MSVRWEGDTRGEGVGDDESFEVVTGFVGGDSPFAPHGRTLRIEVER